GVVTTRQARDLQRDILSDGAKRQRTFDPCEVAVAKGESRGVKMNQRMTLGIEHRLALQESVAQIPAAVDRACINVEVDVATLHFPIDHDRPAHIGEAPALMNDAERVRDVFDLRDVAIDAIRHRLRIGIACGTGRSAYNKRAHYGLRTVPNIVQSPYNHWTYVSGLEGRY